jgi:hypothetical protein
VLVDCFCRQGVYISRLDDMSLCDSRVLTTTILNDTTPQGRDYMCQC